MNRFLKLALILVVISSSVKTQSLVSTVTETSDQAYGVCDVFFKHLEGFEKGTLAIKIYHQMFDVLISDIELVLNNTKLDNTQRLDNVEFMLEYLSSYNSQLLDEQRDKLILIQEKVKLQRASSDDERIKNAKEFLEIYVGSKQESVDATVIEVLKKITNNKIASGRDYLAIEYLGTILRSKSCPKETNLKYQNLLVKIGDLSVLTTQHIGLDINIKMEYIRKVGERLIRK